MVIEIQSGTLNILLYLRRVIFYLRLRLFSANLSIYPPTCLLTYLLVANVVIPPRFIIGFI